MKSIKNEEQRTKNKERRTKISMMARRILGEVSIGVVILCAAVLADLLAERDVVDLLIHPCTRPTRRPDTAPI
jgi:hypothetical protein